MPADVQVFVPDAGLIAQITPPESAVVILPISVDRDGCGTYSESTVFLAKDLRAEGVEARFLHPSEQRSFEVKKSELAAAAAFFSLAIAGNASYDLTKAGFLRLLKRGKASQPMTVELVHIEASGRATGTRISGSADDVIRAIEALPVSPDDPSLES